MNIKSNPYKNKSFENVAVFTKLAIMPLLVFQIMMHTLFLKSFMGAGVCAIVFGIVYVFSHEFELCKYDLNFRNKTAAVYFVTSLFSSIFGYIDVFFPMILLIIFDVFWATQVCDKYKEIYFEVNDEEKA